jgi:putative transposase
MQMMCRVFEVAPSGCYDWLLQPVSNRAQEDVRLLRLIRASFTASHGIYGARRASSSIYVKPARPAANIVSHG